MKTEAAPADQHFTFFLTDESIHEITTPSAEDALRELCQRRGKSRYWVLREVVECLVPV